jgi:hypothetical protein
VLEEWRSPDEMMPMASISGVTATPDGQKMWASVTIFVEGYGTNYVYASTNAGADSFVVNMNASSAENTYYLDCILRRSERA